MASFVASQKDPADTKIYTIDWTQVLAATDSISSVVWTPQAPLTQSGASISGFKSSVFIAGGVSGTEYTLVAKMTSAAGVICQKTILIPVLTQ